jgi:serine/threonine-protein kinase
LFLVGGAVIVAVRKDGGTAQAAPPQVTTQVISVDPPKQTRSTEVAVKLTTTPPGASVFQGDSYFGATPLELKLTRDVHVLSFKLEGYQVQTRNLDLAKLDENRTSIEVGLDPVAKAASPTAGTKPNTGKKKGPGTDQGSNIPVFE